MAMESKVSRIQQWLRDLRLPSLRSRSNIEVSSDLHENHTEELQLSPERFEGVTQWNTNQGSTKIWKSSLNLSMVRHDKQSLNEWSQTYRSQEELHSDSASEGSIRSSLTSSRLSAADSTQSLHEIHHLQPYFTRTMKLEQSQANSPRRRKRLSTSDPDFQFYTAFNDQQEWTPQGTSGIEVLNKIKGYSPSDPHPLTRMKHQGMEPYICQQSTMSIHLDCGGIATHEAYHLAQKYVGEKFLQYSQNIGKYQHQHKRMPEVDTISVENMHFYKTIRMSNVFKRTARKLPLTPQEIKYRQIYLGSSQRDARI